MLISGKRANFAYETGRICLPRLTAMLIFTTVIAYFALLLVLSRLTSRHDDNDTFFRGRRQSPWYVVALGMVGASISGVTFVSVPGMVMTTQMTYLQTCLGFIIGYIIVAFLLLPLFYRANLTTIYSYLDRRLGLASYRAGAACFLVSKMTGAAIRFYVVCMILHRFMLAGYGIPFPLTVTAMVLLIWVYTRRSGIRTLVWTDLLQTVCMFAALTLIIVGVVRQLGMTPSEAIAAIRADEGSRVFVFDDWMSRQNFFKQFLSGIFIVIVMTGLDQDMMQKNLTCRSLRDAQKDMCTYGTLFVPANLLFLSLGVLLTILAAQKGIPLPAKGDELLPMFAATGLLGQDVVALFTLGMVAASFSSADSALTAMTTSTCVDIFRRPDDKRLRRKIHIAMGITFVAIIIAVDNLNSSSIIDAIYTLCSYTYGPLLGLFAYAILLGKDTATAHNEGPAPYIICMASPIVCHTISVLTLHTTGYHFGYELLMLNGLITFIGLAIANRKKDK